MTSTPSVTTTSTALIDFVKANGHTIAVPFAEGWSEDNGLGHEVYVYEDTLAVKVSNGYLAVTPFSDNELKVYMAYEVQPAGTISGKKPRPF